MKRGKVAAKSIKSLLKTEAGGRWKTSNSNFPRLSPLCGKKTQILVSFWGFFLWSSASGGNDVTSEADGGGNTETSSEDEAGERLTFFCFF